ncbi:MAG: hypothetical protein HKM04_03790 [Legionellales bacterium]|nr:hypothetical protein [Legionellales bacterium]
MNGFRQSIKQQNQLVSVQSELPVTPINYAKNVGQAFFQCNQEAAKEKIKLAPLTALFAGLLSHGLHPSPNNNNGSDTLLKDKHQSNAPEAGNNSPYKKF